MINFLIQRFIPNPDQISDPGVRSSYGTLSAVIGIVINLLLALTKGVTGFLINSISVIGDAVNNLSDCATSVVTFISVRFSKRPADRRHPFGHARMEYIGSTAVAVFIFYIGIELLKSSIEKIIRPEPTAFNVWVVVVLLFSISGKLFLHHLNTELGKRINSSILRAVALDSLTDILATSAVLLAAVIAHFSGLQLDPYMGILVAAFVLVSGYKILKDMLSQLLGTAPSEEFIQMIESFIQAYPGVVGWHDLMVHEYGPGQIYASVHVEVDAREPILQSHDLVDRIERDILDEKGIHLVIHMDPLVLDDPYVNELLEITKATLQSFDDSLQLHDFRVVRGKTHTNLIFDVDVPPDFQTAIGDLRTYLQDGIRRVTGQLIYVVLTMDRSYVSQNSGAIRKDHRSG